MSRCVLRFPFSSFPSFCSLLWWILVRLRIGYYCKIPNLCQLLHTPIMYNYHFFFFFKNNVENFLWLLLIFFLLFFFFYFLLAELNSKIISIIAIHWTVYVSVTEWVVSVCLFVHIVAVLCFTHFYVCVCVFSCVWTRANW